VNERVRDLNLVFKLLGGILAVFVIAAMVLAIAGLVAAFS
jgi:hypothetical protein